MSYLISHLTFVIIQSLDDYFALPKYFKESILKLYLRTVLLILISLQMLYIFSALLFSFSPLIVSTNNIHKNQ